MLGWKVRLPSTIEPNKIQTSPALRTHIMTSNVSDENQNGLPSNKPFYDEDGNLHVTVTTGGPNPTSSVRILPKSDAEPRPSGLGKGTAKIKDAFFDPLPDEVLDFFDPHPTQTSPSSD